ncbi:hypothetical protein P6F26_00360 [Roseibacterium sp. SDUM158017]|uniref:hypothetical protein n=1 Tax=Roseicyclus salinarum TaxID=3036773 RepID=UPI002414D110|nr:hypothetical protein [Roseibacterium sp. SDUM158017]MDG4646881.1 hypothetical protein [Roseibacterium sp. SDUM158017]
MDYGYQLLRHVVQQVFGNLRQAAQLTLLLFLAPYIGFVLLGVGAMTGGGMQDPAAAGGGVLAGLVLLGVAVVAYCWAAVGWHRYVLLEETGNGFLPQWRWGRITAYLGRAFLVGLAVVLAVIGGGLVIALVVGLTQSTTFALVLGIGLVLGASWIATRIGLVLPAAAIGERMTLSESWAATRPVSSQILLPLVVVALAVGLAGQVIMLLFGQTVTVEAFGQAQDQVVLSVPGQILNGFVSWIQILVNLALMTTLYGNLIEGRQLN